MRVIDKRTYKTIEWNFYNYFNNRRELQEYKDDVMQSGGQSVGESGGGRSGHSDPTALKAISLADQDIIIKEGWIKIVELTIKHFKGTDKQELLQLKYFNELGEVYICQKIHIDRSTFYSWRNDIVLYAAMVAIQFNLIRIV